jgi:diguanylate cyclase (GGDEF)-like protein
MPTGAFDRPTTFKASHVPADTGHVRSSLLSCGPGARAQRAILLIAATSVVGLAAFLAYSLSGAGGPAVDRFFNDGVYNALLLLAFTGCALRVVYIKTDRTPWILLTGAVGAWATADLLYSFAYANDPPFPSAADAFYLAFYPCCYIGLLLLVRRHIADFNRSLWLDGLTAALAAAALGAAVLVEVVLANTEGTKSVVITNLAYPVGDVLLLSLVVGVFALTGWRPGRMWLFVGLGFICSAIADALFLFQTATDTYVPGTPFDALWPGAMLLIAWSAWQLPEQARGRALQARPWLATPAVAGLTAIGILLYDHYYRLNAFALALAVATLVIVIVRTRMTFRENAHILERIRTQAVTDALTGLGNRRSLVDDLAAALADGETADPRLLVIFDLDGFKRYNDTFGHPSGDQLLRRLGGKLAEAVAPEGASYRLGGDEFCVLAAPGPAGTGRLLDAMVSALSEDGEGFSVTTSFGAVFLPDEASESSEALRLADERLYAQKHSAELARSRPHEVLLQAISEREPGLLEHSRSVARLSLEIGRRLEMPDAQLAELRIAAELHDVGKLAIPDAILLKRGRLTDSEWEFVRRHTVVGQRIVAAAPALREVGRIVRATHERWDGAGYVDGLAGEDIPLAARIISVCDAFKAMTSERPYGRPLTADAALAELRRCSGTQFDPTVVSAFTAALAAGDVEVTASGSPAATARYSLSSPAPRAATRAS